MSYKLRFQVIALVICLFLPEIATAQCYRAETDIHIEQMTSGQKLYERGIDTTSIDAVYDALQNEILLKSQYAALFLAEQGEYEAIELILQKYEEEQEYARGAFRYLKALNMLEYDSIENLLTSFADKLYQQMTEGNATRTEYFVFQDVARLLIEKNNYSQFSRITNLIKSNPGDPSIDVFINLLASYFDIEKFRTEIINTIDFVLHNYSDSDNLFYAVNYTCAFPESVKLKESLTELVVDANSFQVRELALERLRDTYQYANLNDLVLKNLAIVSDPSQISQLLYVIRYQYTPQSLWRIKKLKDESSNQIVREKAEDIYKNYWWLYFNPYGKAFDYSVSRTLDSLIIYTRDVASFKWLGNRGFVKELNNQLENASRLLPRGDSTNAAKQIINYQERLQDVYESEKEKNKERYVTEDGYKFLFKNADYLQEQLNK